MQEQFDSKHIKLHQLNKLISLALRIMTAICLLLILSGMVMYITTGAAHPIEVTPLSQLLDNLFRFSPAGLITLGLFVMLLMPPVILLASFAYFAAMKDRKPLFVCIILLIMLALNYMLILR